MTPSPIASVYAAARSALAPLLAPAGAAPAAPSGWPRVVVALSGGRDSVALLDALASLAPPLPIELAAVHVHHGLSPQADAWAAFCAAQCERRSIPLAIERVAIIRAPQQSLEAAARAARYAALARAGAGAAAIALAHHADDQAETVLLQLLRGAGPQGLAAMPTWRAPDAGPAFVRPFLALPRATVEAYAAARGLAWIDDESNADLRLRRNFLRHEVTPRLAAAFPGYPATLVRAASLQAEAAELADELARIDAREAVHDDATAGATLDRSALACLSPPRARNLLRWFIRRHGLPAPSAARLAAMLAQLAAAAPDARVRLDHGGMQLGIHRGRIVVHSPPIEAFAATWHGEPVLALPHGTLAFVPALGHGVAAAALAGAPVTLRQRSGGERLRLGPGRARRPVADLLQQAGIPWWAREALPFVWCGDALAAVPGIGVDAAFQAHGDEPAFELHWHARDAARPNGKPDGGECGR
jgi:tRNA(Ile)-lysidine synthase